MLSFIKRIFQGRLVCCFECHNDFRENKLKEINYGTVYVEKLACPFCDSENWDYYN